jgi:hypothetical protein
MIVISVNTVAYTCSDWPRLASQLTPTIPCIRSTEGFSGRQLSGAHNREFMSNHLVQYVYPSPDKNPESLCWWWAEHRYETS